MSATHVDTQAVDSSKRTWIIASTCAGAVGAAAVAVPFASTFQPSERAKAAGAAVEVDLADIKPGEKKTVEWRGKPVWVVRRTAEQLAALTGLSGELADPDSKRKPSELTPEYARNEGRSIKPEFFVAVGICTHLGCSPSDKFQLSRNPRSPITGKADFFAPAMVRLLTWRAVCSRTSRHRTTWKSHPICTSPTANC